MTTSLHPRLLKARDDRSIVSIYFKDDEIPMTCGRILAIDTATVVIQALTRYGTPDGFELRPVAKVVRVESDGLYEHRLATLERAGPGAFRHVELEVPRVEPEMLFANFMQKALTLQLPVSIYLLSAEAEVLSGMLTRVEEDHIELKVLTPDGEVDGTSSIDFAAISRVDLNSVGDQVSRILWQARSAK